MSAPIHPTPRFVGLALAMAVALSIALAGEASALLRNWTGYGDGTSWTDPGNWAGGAVPEPGDEALFDNLDTQSDYTVVLPGGAVTVTIARLTIDPSPGRTITLVLPAASTANPGLRVGDGVAGTDDIVLRAGAVLRNSSGASFGNGIELSSSTNGSVRIENGARYVHQTVRSASGIAPFLSSAAGTETGEFVYDTPGTATTNIAASGRTYGSLTLNRSSGPATYGALGSSPLTIRGRLTIGPGVTFASNMTGTLYLGGDVTNQGFTWAVASSQPVVWNGGTVQTLTGAGGMRLHGPGSILEGTTLAVGATLLSAENTLSIAGTLQLDQGAQAIGSGAYVYHPVTGKLVLDQESGSITVDGSGFWPAANGPGSVVVQGAGITMTSPRTVGTSLLVAAPITNAYHLTVGGTLDLQAAGVLTGAPVYTGEARLVYSSARTVGGEWLAGVTTGAGVPKHVDVRTGGGVVQLPASLRTVPGDLTIESGGVRLDATLRRLEVHGHVTTSVATGIEQGALHLSGGAIQRLTGPAGFTLDFLRLEKSGGAAELASDLTVTAPGGGNALELGGSAAELRLAGHRLTLNGAVGGTNALGRLRGAAGSALAITTSSGAAGAVGFVAGSEILQDLSVSAPGGLVISTDLTVEGTLTLGNGAVAMGAGTLTIGPAGSVSRSYGRVTGRLRKHVPAGSSTVRFEIGSASGYTPVTLELASVTTAGTLAAISIDGDHPSLAGSGLDPSRTVNRHWLLEPDGLALGSASAIFQFLPSDRDAGSTPTIYAVRRHDGSAWSPTDIGFRTATGTQVLGLTGFGAFAIGDDRAHTLTVAVLGGGTVSRSPDLPSYPYGSTVTLTANPGMEYHFEQWEGDVSGAQNPLTLTITGDHSVTAVFGLNATALWTGAGDGASWTDAANWDGSQVPGLNDEVHLDHAFVSGSYTVVLPAGAATITVKRLGITSAPGRTITLEIPVSSTANPAILVGDGFTASEDLVLGSGALLRNASGAAGGEGIELDSTGSVRLQDGGRYVHATPLPATRLARALLAVTGTDRGVFEYDVPGAATEAIEAAGVTYGSLVLRRSQGAAAYSMGGAAPMRVRGDLEIAAGVTLVSTMTDSLRLAGNLENAGAPLVLPASQPVVFEGAQAETLTGAGGLRVLGAAAIRGGSSLVVRSGSLTIDGALSVDGTLQLDAGGQALGSGVYAYHPTTGTLVLAPSSRLSVSGPAPWPASGGPSRVSVRGAGVSIDEPRAVSARLVAAGVVDGADRLTIAGDLELSGAGVLSSPPVYAGEARIVYDGPRAVGFEWLEGSAVGSGVPKHVVVRAGSGAVTMPSTNRTVPGNLTIETGVLRLDLDLREIEVRGDFTTLVPQGIERGALSLGGAAHQRLTGPSGFTLEQLRTVKSAGAVELVSDLSLTAPGGVNAIEFEGSAAELWLAGHDLSLTGAVGGANSAGSVRGATGSSMTIVTTGAAGVLRFAPGARLLRHLAISAAGGLTLGTDVTVEGTLTLANGVVNTGTGTLAIATGGSVVRAAGRVVGRLRKPVPTGSPSVTFEIGTAEAYSPVTLAFTGVASPGGVVASAMLGDHPAIAGSGLDASRTVNRHWQLENDGVSFGDASATFHFLAADRDTGTDPATYATRRHDGSAWWATTAGQRTPTSTQVVGLAALGGFAIGEIQTFPVLAGAERNDRYAVRVEYPSATGAPIVVDGQTQPSLTNIDPLALDGRTIVVYRDGRVELTAGGGSLNGGGSNGIESAGPGNVTQQLAPTFLRVPTSFAPYWDGTLMPSWADYDNDGDLDLPLYRNDGNQVFTEIPGFRALLAAGNYHGSSWCDYDADGDLDLVIMGYNFTSSTTFRTLVLRNDGGTFVNAGASQGMNVRGRGETAIWGDFDGDGDPDLFAPYHDHQLSGLPDSSLYYRNDGGGVFTERSFAAGVSMSGDEPPQKPEGADAVDWDGDGDLDLYAASHLFLNDGTGRFTDGGPQAGLPVNFDEGGCFVDFDDDGDFDLYTKNPDTAHLFRNDGGQFVDVTASAGIATSSFLWGDSWADVDNDGDLDLLQYLRNASARLLVNQGNGTFLPDSGVTALGLIGGMSTWGDYDDDGDLDLIDGSAQDFPYTLNANRLDAMHGFDGSFLRVLVLDENGRQNQHRATVELRTVDGPTGRAQARAVGAGTTYLSQNEYRVHFGLGVRGSVARSPDLAEYDLGTTVRLTAIPSPGFTFAGWTGDTSGAANPLDVTVDRARDIRAVFDVLRYPLTTSTTGNGTVAKSPDQATYVHGSRVQVAATPAAGYHFTGWSGDASGTANPITVTVDGPRSVTAHFAINQYPLTVGVTGSGSVSRTPDLQTYPHGSVVQLLATPAANHHFTGWSGDATGAANPVTVTMDGARTVGASFAIDTHPVTVTVSGSGSVTREPDAPEYDHGTSVLLTAVPAPDHHFVGWSGAITGVTNPIAVTVDAAKSITATFAIDTRTLAVATVGNGTVARSPDQPAYDHGTVVTLTATPQPGQSFVGWSGDASGTENPLAVTMDADRSITAIFTWSLAVATQGSGTVSRSPDQSGYAPGTSVVLTATPATGHRFVEWSGDTSGSANPVTLVMNANRSVTAVFALESYTLSLSVAGSGAVSRAPDQPAHAYGDTVVLTATPAPGHHFVGWSGDASGAANPLAVVIVGNTSLTATFAINTYTLSVATTGDGSVAVSPSLPVYEHGSSVTLTATGGPGHVFAGWSGDTTASANPLALTMTRNRSLTAAFILRPLKKWVGASGGGDGVSWSNGGNWNGGSVPAPEDTVVLDASTLSGPYTVNLPAGAATVAVARLSIEPGAAAITLVLPPTNTGNPGLRVGDAIGGTPDLRIAAGGVLRNASGAATGAGIELSSAADATLRIENGGRYVHATLLSAAPVAANLDTGAAVRLGEFEYDVPNRNSFPIAASGVTYGSLTLTRTAGTATYTTSGSSAMRVRGTLRLNTGVTWTSTLTGGLRLGGDLVHNGANLTLPSAMPVQFDGGVLQRVSGTSSLAIQSASTITAPTTLAVGGSAFNNNGTMTIDGAFQIEPGTSPAGSGTYQYHPTTGRLVFNNTALLQIGNSLWWPVTNGPQNVDVLGSGGITMNVNRSVSGVFQSWAPVTKGNRLTLSGINRLNPGASWPNPPMYSGNATLLYTNSDEVGAEWSSGATVGAGVPRNVSIQSPGTITLPTTDRTVPGILSHDTGTLVFQGGDLAVQGNVHLDGVLQLGGASFFLSGGNTQTLGSSGPLSLPSLHLDKTAGSVQLLVDLTLGGSAGHALEFHGTGDVLDLNGRTLTIAGTVGGSDANSTLKGGGAARLVITGAGALGSLTFTPGAQTLDRLRVDRVSAGGVGLGSPLTVTGALELVNGGVGTPGNALTLAPGATVARTNGFVTGGLRKTVPSGAAALTFEVGSGATYAPVEVDFGAVTASGTLTASTTPGDHPNITGAGLDSAQSVNRWWSLVNEGVGFDRYDAVFHYDAAEVDPGVILADLQVRKYDAPSWTALAPGARTATSLEALGMTSFSDFQIGEIQTFTLNVTPVGHGSVSKSPDQPLYDAGSSVTLTATPSPGHAFTGWSGAATGTTNPLTIVMNANKSITAAFTWSLDVSVSGNGSVTRSPDQPVYAPGTVVTLTAVPATGWHFVGWSGAVTSPASHVTVTMDGDKSVTATFAIDTHTLALTTIGDGTAVKSPDQATYDYGTQVTLTATPAPGQAFVGWSGNATGTTNPLTITMDGNKSITATFTWSLDVAVAGNGAVTKSPDQPNYAPGAVVQLTAQPAVGHHLVAWSGDASGTGNPLSVTMDENKSITATFAINTYTITTPVTGSGLVWKSPNQPTYEHGATVELIPVPSEGWHFVSWGGDTSGTATPLVVTMTRDRTVAATFAIDTHALDVTTTGSGAVTKSPDLPAYDHGTSVQLTAVPATGWHFVEWGGDATGSANPVAILMDGPKSVTASFAIDSFTVQVTAIGNGAVVRNPDQPSYPYGTIVTLTALPAADWHLRGWSGDASGSANPLSITVTSNRAITATFDPDNLVPDPSFETGIAGWTTYGSAALSRVPGGRTGSWAMKIQGSSTSSFGCDDSPNVVSTVAGAGRTYRFSAWVRSDIARGLVKLRVYEFAGGSQVGSTYYSNEPALTSAWQELVANYVVRQPGTTLSLRITDLPEASSEAFLVDDVSIELIDSSATYTIHAPPSPGGFVTPAGVTVVAQGESQPYAISPAPGYHLVDVLVDGVSVGPVTSYSFASVSANHTIQASFAINTYTLSVAGVGSGSVARSPDRATYDHGTPVQLVATPATGWRFVAWSGDTTAAANPLDLVMTRDRALTATFEIRRYAIDLTTSGSGSVTKSPDQALYDHGTSVRLTAVPAPGWHFAGWSGDTAASANPLDLAMTRDLAIEATFAIDTHPLGVTVTGNGSVAKNPDQPLYDHGTVVTLTAQPAVGWHLVGWSGDTTTAANPIAITMDAAKSVTATFAIDTHPLEVVVTGNGAVARSPDQPLYDHGAVVTLTATAATGWHFVRWSGDVTGNANPIAITMDGAKSVEAKFAIDTFALAVTVVGGGAVARAPDQADYDWGTIVTLTAQPQIGWHFVGWSGDAGGTANPVTVTMDGPKSVVALFETDDYELGVTLAGSGAVTRSPDQPLYEHGTAVELTATPAAGWHFVGWSGDTATGANPITIVMDAPKSVTATFAIDTHPLDVTVVGNGSVAKSPDQPLYDHGTVVALTALPATGWHFVGWSGDTATAANPVSLTMDGARSVTATFAIDSYPLDLSVAGNGSVTKDPDQPLYDYGTVVTLVATADPHWHLAGWEGDASGGASPLALTMDGPKSVTARFAIDTHALSVAVTGAGAVAKSPDLPSYEHGAAVELTATPASGWHFVGWSGDTATAANPITLVMDAPKNVTAAFAIDTHPLDVTVVGDGSVGKSPDQPLYDHGTVVTLTAQPAAGWHFAGWSGDASGAANPLALPIEGPRAVTATFAIDTHAVVVAAIGNGAAAVSPDRPFHDHGSSVTITATPSPGHEFVGWSGDASGTANPLTLLVDGPKSVTALFTWSLAVAASGEGTVARSPDQDLHPPGSVVTLAATPATGWRFVAWSGDASGAENPLALTMDRDRSVTASFALESYALAVTTTGSGVVLRSPDQPAYPHGSTVQLTAVPAAHWHFVAWSGDATGTSNPVEVGMDGAKAVTAAFAIDTHTLALDVVGQGAVARDPDLPAYDHGSIVQLTPTPAPGWHFVAWDLDVSGSENPLLLTVDADFTIRAIFAIDTHTLEVTTAGGGTVTRNPQQAAYDHGTIVTLTAAPDSGFQFTGWSGDTSAAANPLTIAMLGDRSLVATFADVAAPRVKVIAPNGGESLLIGSTVEIQWEGEDNHGVASVDVLLSRDGAAGPFEILAAAEAADGSLDWLVDGPATSEALLVIVARDSAGHASADTSDAIFKIGGGALSAPADAAGELALAPLVPNPTRGAVAIEYSLPAGSNVTLTVVDLQGRRIATLVDGERAAGRHRVSWAGLRGASAHGVYFVRLQAGGRSLVRRLTVAR